MLPHQLLRRRPWASTIPIEPVQIQRCEAQGRGDMAECLVSWDDPDACHSLCLSSATPAMLHSQTRSRGRSAYAQMHDAYKYGRGALKGARCVTSPSYRLNLGAGRQAEAAGARCCMTVPKTRGICDREAHISMYSTLLNWRCRIALRPFPLNGICRFGLAVSLDAALRSRLVASSAHVGFVTPLACAWPGLPFLRRPRTRYLSKGPTVVRIRRSPGWRRWMFSSVAGRSSGRPKSDVAMYDSVVIAMPKG